MLETNDMKLSEKLQKSGIKVVAISGGTMTQPKAHYFDSTLAKIKAIKNKDKSATFSDGEIENLSEVKAVKKTIEPFSDLKEKLEGKSVTKESLETPDGAE